jgi:hypothetical protein
MLTYIYALKKIPIIAVAFMGRVILINKAALA